VKKLLLAGFLVIGATLGYAQFGNGKRDAQSSNSRLLTGQVMDRSTDTPLPNAVVYLKNVKSSAVKTFIADSQGNFRFPGLSQNVDYEVYAEFQGKRSEVKTISSFDGRPQVKMSLRVNSK
jgi:hypothetical protein